MESPGKNLLKLLVERDPASPEFRDGVREALRPSVGGASGWAVSPKEDDFGLWRDVFVEQPLPWGRFLQSVLLHGAVVALIWTVSISWLRQQKLLDRPTFDQSSVITYTPDEYLPPLDTGVSKALKKQKADPIYAKQPILSVPREADNSSQTIVVPPDLKLNHDVALPNIVATSTIVPAVPLDATETQLSRIAAPDTRVVAPPPEVQMVEDRVVRAGMKTEVIAPPPDLAQTKGHIGLINIGPSQVVAPAPQLTLEEQHSLAARGRGRLPSGGVQPVAPPPSVAAVSGRNTGGRLIALGIHPVTPTGPVPVPAGNRRGTFAASPKGKPGAAGTPDYVSSSLLKEAGGFNGHNGLPSGLHVGGADSGREMASLSPEGARSHTNSRVASPVSDDKITDVDRKVFGGKRVYGRTLNMPNLNSSTGSWVIKFAELDGGRKDGELLEPVATEKPDPGYPLELMRANVHGVVTLSAVIHSDGRVSDIHVLDSPDDRLDSYAAKALAGWKFLPAERAGKPVALQAVVEIPFTARRSF